ncbi:MAG: LysR family transcriptional regulator, partial [Clostridia bacterium]|nr:LysR family transcriptional regulator [Clostridia bacterium]
MTSRELLYIKTIADEKSLTRAAQKLYLTQPSLSHCVASIEKQLGTQLFRRTSGGL